MSEETIEFGEFCGCETIDAETKGHPVKTVDCAFHGPIHGPHVDDRPECPECRSRGVHVYNCPLAPSAEHIDAGLDGVDAYATFLTAEQLAEAAQMLRSIPDDSGKVRETVSPDELRYDPTAHPALKSRTAVEIAMERSEGCATCHGVDGHFLGCIRIRPGSMILVPDRRNPVAVNVGRNPFVQQKEAALSEITKSDYSMRRRGLIRPERGRMVVARIEFDEQLGSIFLPDQTQKIHTETNMEVVVLACGDNRIDPATGRELHMQYEPADTLGRHAMVRQHSGLEFIWYDENGEQKVVYLIGQAEVWGWLDPAPGDEVHHSPELQRTLRYVASGLAQKALPMPSGCPEMCSVCNDEQCAVSVADKFTGHEHRGVRCF